MTSSVNNNAKPQQSEMTVAEATKNISKKYTQNWAVKNVRKMLQKATDQKKAV